MNRAKVSDSTWELLITYLYIKLTLGCHGSPFWVVKYDDFHDDWTPYLAGIWAVEVVASHSELLCLMLNPNDYKSIAIFAGVEYPKPQDLPSNGIVK